MISECYIKGGAAFYKETYSCQSYKKEKLPFEYPLNGKIVCSTLGGGLTCIGEARMHEVSLETKNITFFFVPGSVASIMMYGRKIAMNPLYKFPYDTPLISYYGKHFRLPTRAELNVYLKIHLI